jgi:hypothetical protein
MLPKILRMRREVVERAVGTSFTLVAMLIPALGGAPSGAPQDDRQPERAGARMNPGGGQDTKVERFFPQLPHHSFGPLRGIGPCPGEDGKDPGRTEGAAEPSIIG